MTGRSNLQEAIILLIGHGYLIGTLISVWHRGALFCIFSRLFCLAFFVAFVGHQHVSCFFEFALSFLLYYITLSKTKKPRARKQENSIFINFIPKIGGDKHIYIYIDFTRQSFQIPL